MDNDLKTWLYDILCSINEIESYFIETPKMFEIYQNDLRTKRAVERNIEIIGEAISSIGHQSHPRLPAAQWARPRTSRGHGTAGVAHSP